MPQYLFRLFENRVASRMFELKKEAITGGWRKWPNEDFS
jgi:hypothetical protein